MTSRPKIFLASSTEGLEVAQSLKRALLEWADCSLWSDPGIFVAGTTIIESLERALPRFPYAVFVMTPDDSADIRDSRYLIPRDNLVFELGFFAGPHGRRSVFIVLPRGRELKLPSDLAGVVTCSYSVQSAPGAQGHTYDVFEASERIREAIGEVERTRVEFPMPPFWSILSDNVVIVFGLDHSVDDPPGVHPRISPRDLDATQAIVSFLGRHYPRKRVFTSPAAASGWRQIVNELNADLIVVGGFMSNPEFARHQELYQRDFRLKMGRVCRVDGQRCHHVEFALLPPGMKRPSTPIEIDHFPSEYVSRDFATIFNRRMHIYGASRRVIGIAGAKGNGTRAAALYLTSGIGDHLLDCPLDSDDNLDAVVTTELIHGVVDHTKPTVAVLNGRTLFDVSGVANSACELGRACEGCRFGELLDVQAIIFDLDDTIVDTFTTLIEPLESQAAMRMVESGCHMAVEELTRLLLQLRLENPDGLDAVLTKVLGECPSEVLTARNDVFASVPAEKLSLTPQVKDLLENLGQRYDLFLLTEGDAELQNRKVRHLGLRPFFKQVMIVESGPDQQDKESAIRALLASWRLDPTRVAVVGNRVEKEITAGLNLGLATVWVQQGEGSRSMAVRKPDHTLANVLDLPSVLMRAAPSDRPI